MKKSLMYYIFRFGCRLGYQCVGKNKERVLGCLATRNQDHLVTLFVYRVN
jgi:hypothetical protein